MKNEIINYQDLIKRNQELKRLKEMGLIIIPKKRLKVVGYILIGLGVVTIPIPFTSLPLITLGLFMLGLSYQKIIENLKRKIKIKLWSLRR